MLTDHLGLFIFNDNLYFRLIGRMAFPLFAWAIANGSVYTNNIYKYLLRIFLLAIISQIPYHLLFNYFGATSNLNILFTYSLALITIITIKKTKNFIFRFISVFLMCLLAVIFNVDYGVFGILTVIIFYLFFDNRVKEVLAYLLIISVFFIFPLAANSIVHGLFQVDFMDILEVTSVFSLLFVFSYNRQIGYKMKYFFYAFYPLHLTLIYLIKVYFLH